MIKKFLTMLALACLTAAGAYADGIEVTPTANANEWTFTMPGGDVELEVAYKDRTAVQLAFGGAEIPAEGVAAYLGFEAEFADSLAVVVTNIDSTASAIVENPTLTFKSSNVNAIAFKDGEAIPAEGVAAYLGFEAEFADSLSVVVTNIDASATVENPTLTFKSSNVNAIAFKDGEAFVDEGALGNMVFRAATGDTPVTLTVGFAGSDDLGKSSTNILVAVSEKTYTADLAAGTEDADKWTAKAGEGDFAALPLENVSTGAVVTVQYGGEKVVKSVKAVDPKLAVPMTIEALTAGTIKVNIGYGGGTLTTGMKYSKNGGEKTTIYNTTDIVVAEGDTVQFYGNGTSTQVYGDSPVGILGNGAGFTCKVYGNIMSLVDETGFATNKTLTANKTFTHLF